MKRSLLEHLVCPVDKQPLIMSNGGAKDREVIEGTLVCRGSHTYRIADGVPRLVVPEALSAEGESTRASFSAKWRRIPNFGFDDASREFYTNWYLQRYGFDGLDDLRAFLANKRTILEAGTGVGRDALLYGGHTAGQVFALDLSESVVAAYRNVGHLPNVHLVQADLTRLPFCESSFDFVVSDQVLHHTSNTEQSFKYLARYVAPGGHLAAYVYKKKGPIREFCDDYLRAHYTQGTDEECYEFSSAMTKLGKALHELGCAIEVPEDIPILGIKKGRYDLQRFLYWNVFKCYWNERLDFETNVMTNFDWYRPVYAYRHTPDEVLSWCADLGFEVVHFNVVESGISVRARRPEMAPAAG